MDSTEANEVRDSALAARIQSGLQQLQGLRDQMDGLGRDYNLILQEVEAMREAQDVLSATTGVAADVAVLDAPEVIDEPEV